MLDISVDWLKNNNTIVITNVSFANIRPFTTFAYKLLHAIAKCALNVLASNYHPKVC